MHKTIINGAPEFVTIVRVIPHADGPDEILVKTHTRNALDPDLDETTIIAMAPAQARETAAALIAAADIAEGK